VCVGGGGVKAREGGRERHVNEREMNAGD